MTIAVPALTFQSGRTPWSVRVPALASIACGVAIIVSPDTPVPARMLGAAVIGISLFGTISSRWAATVKAGLPQLAVREIDAAKDTVANDTGTPSTMLNGVHHDAPQDMQTAMQLFGSAIVDQVDTSVNTVLSENHQMREMASEMATASTQAKDQFKGAMLRAVEAECE